MEGTMNKLQTAAFKFVDIIVLLTMVLTGPFNIAAVAMQDPAPALAADKADYAPGELAHVTGAGFTPGDYVLTVMNPDATVADWATVTAGGDGGFASDSPALDSEGNYELRAYALGSVDWSSPPVASISFTVTAPAPTEEPAATEPPTEEPAQEPTEEPTIEPTTEPELIPFVQSDKEDYQPGELVTLTGGNWQGDTQVRIVVNDNVGQTWTRDVIVDVAPDGTIIDSFNLPTWFVASYLVSAGGQLTGRVVTTTFTDAPILSLTKSASPLTYTAAGQVINFSYVLKNTSTGGTVLNGPFTVTDNKVPTVTCPATATLAVGASITCTGTYSITAADMALGYAVNTATAASSAPNAATSNPDVRIVSFPVTCRNDSAGANDVPGQKDLTQECESPTSTNPMVISWNWDVMDQPGGNSADACALFDTDNDGLANYALCVSWQGQRVMQSGYPQLYSCADTRSDRCTGPTPLSITNGSACAVELASDDSFSGGTDFPLDTKAFCSINLADVGGAQISSLIDVCSYPSAVPNSAPSDCVVISTARGNLEVIKSVVPNDTSTNWNMSWTGPTPYSTTITGSGDTGIQPVTAGSYNLSEAAGSGTDLSLYDSTWACTVNGSASSSGSGTSISGVSVANGNVVICTFTNTRKTGSLQIFKDVAPDAPSTNWDFAATGPTPYNCSIAGDGSCTAQTVFTGSYSVTETAGSGTNLGDYGTSWACTVDGSPGPSGSGTTLSGLTINKNEIVVCTFTNSQSPGTITVNKVVVPSADTGLFNLLIDGTVEASDVGDSGTTGAIAVSAGSHTVSETAGTGTDLTNYVTTFSGDCDSSGNVSVQPNQNKTCTITNTRKGTIIVEKQTSPDGAAGSFTFTGDIAGTIFDNGQLTVSNLAPGTYTSTENDPLPDFALTSIACDDGSSATPSTFDLGTRTATFKLDPGETVKCTFTNTQQQGTLTVIKQVITDNGGIATADQWSIHVKSGVNEVAGSPQPGSGIGTVYTLNPGTYTVSETGGPSGYTFTGFTDDCDGSGNVTVVAGQAKTCTLTNDDQAATLIVIKHVVNDNGGTASAGDFTLDSGGTNDSPDNFAGEEAPGTTVTLDAGSYNVTETGPSGYSASFSAGCTGTVANGETKTCTVTNDDQPATLIVIKHVNNDNGGTAAAGDFTMNVTATNPSDDSFPGAESPGTTITLDAGSYSVSETGPAGYTASYSADCSGTIANGQTKTCTVTNDDQPAHLKLVKEVVNNNGGTAIATNFTLSASGPTPLSGAGGAESDVDAGTYTLSETNVPGYSASAWSCVGGTQNGSEITLANGQSATCTITNDDMAPLLILQKVVIDDNGGTALAGQWTLTASGPTDFSGSGPSVSSGADFEAGTYSLSESGPDGYFDSNWDCEGGTQNGSDITLALGEAATCTITNDDDAPSLKLIKQVINNNGGTAAVSAFTLTADGPTPLSGAGGAMSDETFKAGTYNLSETNLPGYTASDWVCTGVTQDDADTVTVGLGDDVTCTITNDDQPATLIVIKHVLNDNGGTATAGDFTMSVTGTNPSPASFAGQEAPGTTVTLNAGSYNVSETGPTGYTDSYSANCSGTLAIGETKTCTVTNDDQQSFITVVKVWKAILF
jgi:hypothetical protein